jgi:hypothetical protein
VNADEEVPPFIRRAQDRIAWRNAQRQRQAQPVSDSRTASAGTPVNNGFIASYVQFCYPEIHAEALAAWDALLARRAAPEIHAEALARWKTLNAQHSASSEAAALTELPAAFLPDQEQEPPF